MENGEILRAGSSLNDYFYEPNYTYTSTTEFIETRIPINESIKNRASTIIQLNDGNNDYFIY